MRAGARWARLAKKVLVYKAGLGGGVVLPPTLPGYHAWLPIQKGMFYASQGQKTPKTRQINVPCIRVGDLPEDREGASSGICIS